MLYSNRSRPMFTNLEDTCGRHDFMLTPCSKAVSVDATAGTIEVCPAGQSNNFSFKPIDYRIERER